MIKKNTEINNFLNFKGSNDNNTKFWTRNRPGDTQEDIFGLTTVYGINPMNSSMNPVNLNISNSHLNHNDDGDENGTGEDNLISVIPGIYKV